MAEKILYETVTCTECCTWIEFSILIHGGLRYQRIAFLTSKFTGTHVRYGCRLAGPLYDDAEIEESQMMAVPLLSEELNTTDIHTGEEVSGICSRLRVGTFPGVQLSKTRRNQNNLTGLASAMIYPKLKIARKQRTGGLHHSLPLEMAIRHLFSYTVPSSPHRLARCLLYSCSPLIARAIAAIAKAKRLPN